MSLDSLRAIVGTGREMRSMEEMAASCDSRERPGYAKCRAARVRDSNAAWSDDLLALRERA